MGKRRLKNSWAAIPAEGWILIILALFIDGVAIIALVTLADRVAEWLVGLL